MVLCLVLMMDHEMEQHLDHLMEKHLEQLMAYRWVSGLVNKMALHLDMMMAIH